MTHIELIIEKLLDGAYATGPGSVRETAKRVALEACAKQRDLCAEAFKTRDIMDHVVDEVRFAGLEIVEKAGS